MEASLAGPNKSEKLDNDFVATSMYVWLFIGFASADVTIWYIVC